MKTFNCALSALLLSTTAVLAGSPEPAPMPVPVDPAPVVAGDWAGFYGGLSYASISNGIQSTGPTRNFGSDNAAGLFVGYNFQNGALIYGGELSWNQETVYSGLATNADRSFAAIGSDERGVSDVITIKGRVGYDLGRFMVYGTLGYAMADYVHPKVEYSIDGPSYGIGAAMKVTDRIFAGIELEQREMSGRPDFIVSGNSTHKQRVATVRIGMQF